MADKNKDVLISVSTGELSNADQLGLVKNHAYAVLGSYILFIFWYRT